MGRIFDIQRLSVHDGPGIRTTVFLKGCPLACPWCHNPEGLSEMVQLKYADEKCILCGNCVEVCSMGVHRIDESAHQVDFSSCTACGLCVSQCPARALELVGREMTAKEVVDLVARDDVFFGRDGGVTFSGGECLMQPSFLLELLKESKTRGYSAFVDTSGFAPWSAIERILSWVDGFLYDVKAVTPELHRAATGVDNRLILENLVKLQASFDGEIQIRTPLVGAYNATMDEVRKIADFLVGLRISGIRLMPYHVLGRSKRAQIGLPSGEVFESPSPEEMKAFQQVFLERGIAVRR